MAESWSNKINRYHPELKGDPFKGFKEKRKVRIIPKKNRFIPDLLPNNGRIYDETKQRPQYIIDKEINIYK